MGETAESKDMALRTGSKEWWIKSLKLIPFTFLGIILIFSFLYGAIYVYGVYKSPPEECRIYRDNGGYHTNESCIINLAIEKESTRICERYLFSPFECIDKVALETGNPEDCEKDYGKERYDPLCVGKATKSLEVCENFDYGYETPIHEIEYCKIGVAIQTEDVEICVGLKEVGPNCINLLSDISNDSSICSRYYDTDHELYEGSRFNSVEESLDYMKNLCISKVGYRTGDPDLCSQIEPNYDANTHPFALRNNCYMAAGIKNLNTDYCLLSGDSRCFSAIAVEQENPEACKLFNESLNEFFIEEGIEEWKKSSYYRDVEDCYVSVARVTMDEEICEFIVEIPGKGSLDKDSCIKSIYSGVKIKDKCDVTSSAYDLGKNDCIKYGW